MGVYGCVWVWVGVYGCVRVCTGVGGIGEMSVHSVEGSGGCIVICGGCFVLVI